MNATFMVIFPPRYDIRVDKEPNALLEVWAYEAHRLFRERMVGKDHTDRMVGKDHTDRSHPHGVLHHCVGRSPR
jgi:hypothetical protein